MTRLSLLVTLLCVAAPVSAQTPAIPPTTQAAGESDSMHPRYKMETSLGNIVLELDAAKAPVTVLNFNSYVTSGYYNGTIFHRVMSTFMIQGGGFTADMEKKTEGLFPGIKNEWQNGLKNNKGTISMARQGGKPDSGTSQFFINVVDNGRLDQPQRDGAAYAVFGSVVEGMDVVEKIRDTEVHSSRGRRPARSPARLALRPRASQRLRDSHGYTPWP